MQSPVSSGESTVLPAAAAVNATPSANGVALPSREQLLSGDTFARERAIIWVTSLGHFLCHLAEVMFACVLVELCDEFRLETHEGTLLGLLGYVLFGVGALPVGVWADRWGTRNLLCGYFFFLAGSAVAVALAPSVLTVFLAFTALGLAASIYHPAGLAMISLGVARRSRAMGINGVAGNLGIAAAPLVAWLSVHELGDWRWAYGIVAGLCLVGGAMMLWAISRGALAGLTPSIAPVDHAKRVTLPPPTPEAPDSLLRRYTPLILLLGAMMMAGINYRCMMTALPNYVPVDTRYLATLPLLIGAVGQIAGGLLGDRFGARPVYLFMVASLIPLAAIMSLLEGSLLVVAVASLLAVTMFAQQPVENTLLAESTSAARRSISYGWKFVLTFGVGASGAQIAGLVRTYTGSWATVFVLMSCLAGVMLALLVVQTRKANQQGVH
jgi:MFS transporter, FSR family, fosmidomycin resistance protein